MAVGPYWVGDIPKDDLTISVTRNGAAVDLSAYTGVSVIVLDPLSAVTASTLTAAISGNNIILSWPTDSIFTMAGVYTIIPTLTNVGVQEVIDPLAVVVNAVPSTEGWVTPAQVLQITRVTVTPEEIASAISIIELVSARDLSDPTAYKVADIRNLRYAIAWQAAHLNKNPKVMTELAATSKSVNGVAVSYDLSQGSSWLAPLARLALIRVSGRGNRTVLLGRLRDKVPYDPLLESNDGADGWVPTPMGA